MSKVIRALFVSAVATGVAAVVMTALRSPKPPRPRQPSMPGYVDAEALSADEQEHLAQELAAHV